MKTTELVHLDRVGRGVARLVLDNPPLNLVTMELTVALETVLKTVSADSSVRAVVVTGSGDRAFCAGSDIREFPRLQATGRVMEDKLERENRAFDLLEALPQPTVAALRGLVLGGGLEIALCCDLRVAGETCQLGAPEIKLGIFPASGGLYRLPRTVSESNAKRLMFLGDVVGSAEAHRIGLVDEVVPAEQAIIRAEQLAGQLASLSQPALRAIKKGVRETAWVSRTEALSRSLQLSRQIFATEEAGEGVAAFIAKRPARFVNKEAASSDREREPNSGV
jgi:enoyl-CoA hydratase/carnithine racemase